jgi:ribokinase
MSADVVVVGPITQDLTLGVETLPEAGGSVRAKQVRERVGGKGANPAIACAQLGARTALVGAVGDDKVGKRLRKQLASLGIDVSLVHQQPDEATGRIVHMVEPDGQRRYIEAPGANDSLTIDGTSLRAVLGSQSWVLISTALPAAAVVAAAEAARDAGARIALDLAGPVETNRAVLPHGHLARVDAAEASTLTDSDVTDFHSAATAARWLQMRGPDMVVVQAGTDGDLLRVHTEDVQMPRRPVTTVDPTGAGDAFIATLITRLVAGDEPARAAALASTAAGHTATQFGGTPRFDLDQLTAWTDDAD